LWSLSDEELLVVLAAGERAVAKVAAARLALVREADGRDLASRSGAASTAALLRWRLRLTPTEAKARVDLAAALDGPLAATRAALAAGDISVEHAQVIRRTMRALPADLPSATVRDAEATLVGDAANFDAKELALLGTHLRNVINPRELADRERRAAKARELRIIDQGDGTHRITGILDNEAAATLRSALDPLAAPRSSPNPADNGPADSDPGDDAGDTGGPRHPGSHPDTADECGDGSHTGDGADTDAGDGAGTGDGGGGGRAGRGGKGRDPRSPARRLADALVDLAELALGGGWLPRTGGVRPHLTITATIETLLGLAGAPAAEADWGGPVSAETLRRIGCDSWITRVLLNEHGVPLDIGREHRLVPPGMRRAVVARDRCCTFPGCDRPPSWCIAYHIIHRVDGGPTSLDNLALLCKRHHTLIHHGDWAMRLGTDGLPEFIPPPWIDPDRTPRNNPHTHRLADLLNQRPTQTNHTQAA
jgi:Domain of unknown function (DUF222)